jgi:hypothetical protein
MAPARVSKVLKARIPRTGIAFGGSRRACDCFSYQRIATGRGERRLQFSIGSTKTIRAELRQLPRPPIAGCSLWRRVLV